MTSETKVPMPEPRLRFKVELTESGERLDYTRAQVIDYGDARASERDALWAFKVANVCEKLQRAGGSLPAPDPKGTIESAMQTGLSIALAVIEGELTLNPRAGETA